PDAQGPAQGPALRPQRPRRGAPAVPPRGERSLRLGRRRALSPTMPEPDSGRRRCGATVPPVTEPVSASGEPVMGEPDPTGRFGDHGGRFVPESLMPALIELDAAFRDAWADPAFRSELDELLRSYA